MNELTLRLLTGAVLVGLVVLGTLVNAPLFFGVFGVIGLMSMVEYVNIFMLETPKSPLKIVRKIFSFGLIAFPFIAMVAFFYDMPLVSEVKTWLLYIVTYSLLMAFELLTNDKKPLHNLAYTAFGTLYLGFSFALLVYLVHFNHVFFEKSINASPSIILGIVLLIFMNDSLAYVFGRWLGKRPLFPNVSAKKTWEGAIGGGICTALLATTYPFVFQSATPYWYDWVAIACIVAVFGVVGDLIESMIKRHFNLKDSQDAIGITFLPGHGGFLDRFDSFIFVVPFIAMYFIWMYL